MSDDLDVRPPGQTKPYMEALRVLRVILPLPTTVSVRDTDLPPKSGPVWMLVYAIKWAGIADHDYAEIGIIVWGAGGLPPRLLCGLTAL